MHELQQVHDAVTRVIRRGGRGLLITVIGTRGSTYRRAGARSVIADDGEVTGAISGGCVERDLALRTWPGSAAGSASFAAGPRLVTYDSSSSEDIVFGLGLGCRGSITMLVEPFDALKPPSLPPVPGRAAILHTTTFEGRAVLVETIAPQRRIAVFGRGPDVLPVEAMARAAAWDVEVVRTRELPPLDHDAVVVMTHNFLDDVAIVEAALRSRAEYIGLLGPKKRGLEVLTQIDDPGPDALRRLHTPIGLDLGGDTAEAIALSIVSEIQAVFHRRDGRPLREKDSPIHERTVAIVLAAGLSTRFGSLKQLVPIDGEPMVRRAALVALAAGCDETIVVTSSPEVSDALRDLPVRVVHNPEPSHGIASSIHAAVNAAGSVRMLFTLCDQPLVTAEHLRAIVSTEGAIVASEYGDVVGVPAVFDRSFAAELLELRGDAGARRVIERHRSDAVVVRFEDASVDVDTCEDLPMVWRGAPVPEE